MLEFKEVLSQMSLPEKKEESSCWKRRLFERCGGHEWSPPADRLEVCFAGRSNVGKSSLINAVTGRKSIARASNTPGRTQEINFFKTEDHHYLVDLPGYGFANAPIDVVKNWQQLLKRYLSGRSSLRRAFVLIDIRHGIKKVDEEIMDLLDTSAVTFQCVLTKCDKVNLKQKNQILDQVERNFKPTQLPFQNY